MGHSAPQVSTDTISQKIVFSLIEFIYSFHMPLFFIMAGFVFGKKIGKLVNWQQKKEELQKKWKRLINPYLIISIITLGLKQIFSKEAYHEFHITEAWKILVGENPNGGLWFLWTLFLISCFFILYNSIKNRFLPGIIFLFLYFISNQFVEGAIINLSRNLIFYYAGIVLYENYELLERVKSNRLWKYSIALISINIIGYQYCNQYLLWKLVCAFTGSFSVLLLCRYLLVKDGRIRALLNRYGKLSYELYLYSYFIQVPVRVICYNKLHVPFLTSCFLMWIAGTVLTLFIVEILKKEKKEIRTAVKTIKAEKG